MYFCGSCRNKGSYMRTFIIITLAALIVSDYAETNSVTNTVSKSSVIKAVLPPLPKKPAKNKVVKSVVSVAKSNNLLVYWSPLTNVDHYTVSESVNSKNWNFYTNTTSINVVIISFKA